MSSYYDENFGMWRIDNQDDIDFYHNVQRKSIRKKCRECGKMVKLLPQYDLCNSCCERIERYGGY